MDKKLLTLQRILKSYGRILVAYSGGVDSSYLLAEAARTLGKSKVLAVTAVSETYPAAELAQAKNIARKLGARHTVIRTKELANKDFKENSRERCFHCKNELFKKLSVIAKQNKMTPCDATNYSDRTDYRPGRRAAKLWHVASPLADALMTKDDIRRHSRALKLPTWHQPAQACLASRIPYGTAIEPKELKKIEAGEIVLKKLGFALARLRHHGEIVRIEIDRAKLPSINKPAIRQKITRALKKLGWKYIALDLEGYRTGSMNE